jgi:hypothetical protein
MSVANEGAGAVSLFSESLSHGTHHARIFRNRAAALTDDLSGIDHVKAQRKHAESSGQRQSTNWVVASLFLADWAIEPLSD